MTLRIKPLLKRIERFVNVLAGRSRLLFPPADFNIEGSSFISTFAQHLSPFSSTYAAAQVLLWNSHQPYIYIQMSKYSKNSITNFTHYTELCIVIFTVTLF